jgi:hypothetical protein
MLGVPPPRKIVGRSAGQARPWRQPSCGCRHAPAGQLAAQRVDIRAHAVVHIRVGVEIAVRAAAMAKRDVNIEMPRGMRPR